MKRLWRQVYLHVQDGLVDARPDTGALTDAQKAVRRQIHQTIQKVSDDVGRRHTFNTAIAANMELLNTLYKFADDSDNGRSIRQEALTAIILMLVPIVPHICDRLWQELGHREALVTVAWPQFDKSALQLDELQLVVQVNGKLRGKISVAADAGKEQVEAAACNDVNVQRFIAGKTIRKVIVVPKKLVNIVV